MPDFTPITATDEYGATPDLVVHDEDDHEAITALLLGHKVTKVADDHLLLDNGTLLKLVGHEGGCACGAGDYELTELNGVDNVITAVEFRNDPDEEYRDEKGVYQIFVFADNQKINLATFEGHRRQRLLRDRLLRARAPRAPGGMTMPDTPAHLQAEAVEVPCDATHQLHDPKITGRAIIFQCDLEAGHSGLHHEWSGGLDAHWSDSGTCGVEYPPAREPLGYVTIPYLDGQPRYGWAGEIGATRAEVEGGFTEWRDYPNVEPVVAVLYPADAPLPGGSDEPRCDGQCGLTWTSASGCEHRCLHPVAHWRHRFVAETYDGGRVASDAEFLAASRTDVPRLLGEVELQRARVTSLSEQCIDAQRSVEFLGTEVERLRLQVTEAKREAAEARTDASVHRDEAERLRALTVRATSRPVRLAVDSGIDGLGPVVALGTSIEVLAMSEEAPSNATEPADAPAEIDGDGRTGAGAESDTREAPGASEAVVAGGVTGEEFARAVKANAEALGREAWRWHS